MICEPVEMSVEKIVAKCDIWAAKPFPDSARVRQLGMREIVFDTETTGLDALGGDRLVEIGCVELHNHIPTGRNFHTYINPQRPVAPDAVAVHGLTDSFLQDKPCFHDVAADFLAFVDDSNLVAHNAAFDRSFINMELSRLNMPMIDESRFVDTLILARRRHAGGSNSLDALCAKYGIDNSARTKHGALLDAEILSEVYIELLGGRQAALSLSATDSTVSDRERSDPMPSRPTPIPSRIDGRVRQAHRLFVKKLSANALWRHYFEDCTETTSD